MFAIVNFHCRTKIHEFQNGGWIILLRTNSFIQFLSFIKMTDCGLPQIMCTKFLDVSSFAENSLAYMYIFIHEGVTFWNHMVLGQKFRVWTYIFG